MFPQEKRFLRQELLGRGWWKALSNSFRFRQLRIFKSTESDIGSSGSSGELSGTWFCISTQSLYPTIPGQLCTRYSPTSRSQQLISLPERRLNHWLSKWRWPPLLFDALLETLSVSQSLLPASLESSLSSTSLSLGLVLCFFPEFKSSWKAFN